MMILFLFISKLLRHYWSGPLPSVAFTFRLRLIFRLSTNEDGKSTSKSCCKQPKLILFFWIRILTVVVKKSKSWNHWRINLFGIKKACFFCTYHNPNFLYKMMQDSSHFPLINFGSKKTRQVQSNPLHIQYLMWPIWSPKYHLWQVFYRNCLVGISPQNQIVIEMLNLDYGPVNILLLVKLLDWLRNTWNKSRKYNRKHLKLGISTC